MGIWVPPAVQRQMMAEQQDYEMELVRQSHTQGVIDRWDPELKRIHPCLHLIRASERASEFGLRPGFWHFLINPQVPGVSPTLIVLEWPNGSFREPDSSMFDVLAERDLWDSRVVRDRKVLKENLDRAERAAKEREKQDRIREVDERWAAARRTQVSMSTDTPWTQNASPHARRDRDSRKKAA